MNDFEKMQKLEQISDLAVGAIKKRVAQTIGYTIGAVNSAFIVEEFIGINENTNNSELAYTAIGFIGAVSMFALGNIAGSSARNDENTAANLRAHFIVNE